MAPSSNNPKPHQFRNLAFTDHRPKFLANIDAALRGSKPEDDGPSRRPGANKYDQDQETEVLDPNRPAIPVRPREDDDEEPLIVSNQDHTGMGRLSDEDEQDEDSPLVVVVKEGRDLSKEEVEAEKIRLRDNPNAPSCLPSSSRASIKASLSFSSNDKSSTSSGKRKMEHLNVTGDKIEGGWSELVKRTKGDKAVMVSTIKEDREAAQRASLTKKEKKLELKAKNKKAKSLMSFS